MHLTLHIMLRTRHTKKGYKLLKVQEIYLVVYRENLLELFKNIGIILTRVIRGQEDFLS